MPPGTTLYSLAHCLYWSGEEGLESAQISDALIAGEIFFLILEWWRELQMPAT